MKKIFLATVSLFIFLAFTNGVPFIYSDGYAAFHTTQAIVEEGSWIYSERPEHYDYRGHVIDQNIDTGEYTVVYPPGTAILNIPGQFIADLLENDSATIYSDYFKATNGHTLAEGFGFLITANIFGLLTIYILYKTLKSLTNNSKIAVISTVVSYISSYAIWYVMLNPSFTHTYELFGVTLATYGIVKLEIERLNKRPLDITLAVQKNKDHDKASIDKADKAGDAKDRRGLYIFFSGVGIGIATICRPVLGILGVGIGAYYLYYLVKLIIKDIQGKRIDKKLKLLSLNNILKNLHTLWLFILGGAPFAMLLLSYNYVSYGKLFASGYNESRGETFQFEEWNGLKMLFSFERGWFIYSPVFILGVIGLILLWRKSKFLSIYSLTSIFSLILIYGFWPAWWAGGSYGHRFLIPAMPFAALGIAYLLTKLKKENLEIIVQSKEFRLHSRLYKPIYIILILFTFWSLLLTLLYRFTPVAELKPKDEIVYSGGRIWPSGDRYTPYDIFRYHYDLVTEADSLKGYINDLIDSGNGGNSIIPILLGEGNTTIRIDERGNNETDDYWVRLYILKPPLKGYTIDYPIEFYLVDNINKKTFQGELIAVDENKYEYYLLPLTTDFLEGIETFDDINDLTINPIEGANSLPRDEYKGFILKDGEYSIYFKNTNKLFFKGDEIRLSDIDTEFKIH